MILLLLFSDHRSCYTGFYFKRMSACVPCGSPAVSLYSIFYVVQRLPFIAFNQGGTEGCNFI